MKNLFLVVNKEKIYAYVVSILTIVTIFFMSSMIGSDLKNTEETSTNNVENSAIGEAASTSSENMGSTNNENTAQTEAEIEENSGIDAGNGVKVNAEIETNGEDGTEGSKSIEEGAIGEAVSTSNGNMDNEENSNNTVE